jgi:hypothetical protein
MAHMSFSHQSVLVEEIEIPILFFDEKCGKKIRESAFGIKLSYVICSLFHRKGRDELMYFFIGFGSIGTDGARTRSFRLDRAVL